METNQQGMVKATDVVSLRKMFREKSDPSEKLFLAKLSPEAKRIYETIMPASWISQQIESDILAIGARVLFTDHPAPVRELGRQLAHKSMSSVYKAFLRIPTTRFLAKQIPRLWRAFFNKGFCEVADLQNNSLTIVVNNFPELISDQREEICGYIIGIMEMTGARDVQIATNDSNPAAWQWHVRWS